MQTFLPYDDFNKSAKCLDYRRLGKQRVEAYQVYRVISGTRTTGGWINHPVINMWTGFCDALADYHNVMIREWISRGYVNNMKFIYVSDSYELPKFIGCEDFHDSHRSNLLKKDYNFYSRYNWEVPDNLPYLWPGKQL